MLSLFIAHMKNEFTLNMSEVNSLRRKKNMKNLKLKKVSKKYKHMLIIYFKKKKKIYTNKILFSDKILNRKHIFLFI